MTGCSWSLSVRASSSMMSSGTDPHGCRRQAPLRRRWLVFLAKSAASPVRGGRPRPKCHRGRAPGCPSWLFRSLTNGHAGIIERALRIFDRVIVAVDQRSKKALFTFEERTEMIDVPNEARLEIDSLRGSPAGLREEGGGRSPWFVVSADR